MEAVITVILLLRLNILTSCVLFSFLRLLSQWCEQLKCSRLWCLGSLHLIFLWIDGAKLLKINSQVYTEFCVELLLKHKFYLGVYANRNTHWCHCQTQVLMTPVIQIFPFLQGAIELSWQFTVCSAYLCFIAHIFHMTLCCILFKRALMATSHSQTRLCVWWSV